MKRHSPQSLLPFITLLSFLFLGGTIHQLYDLLADADCLSPKSFFENVRLDPLEGDHTLSSVIVSPIDFQVVIDVGLHYWNSIFALLDYPIAGDNPILRC